MTYYQYMMYINRAEMLNRYPKDTVEWTEPDPLEQTIDIGNPDIKPVPRK